MRKCTLLIITLLCFFKVGAQVPYRIEDDKVDSLGVIHPTKAIMLSIGIADFNDTHDYFTTYSGKFFITPNFSLDAKYGFSFDKWKDNKPYHFYTVGFKQWYRNKLYGNSFSPFIGVNLFRIIVPDYDHFAEFDHYYGTLNIEVPAGISYTTKSGLHTSLQLSYIYWNEGWEDFMNFELAVGWRFNLRNRKVGLASANLHVQNSSLKMDSKVDSMGVTHPTKAISISMGIARFNDSWGNFTTLNSKFFITPGISLDAKYGFSHDKRMEDKRIHIYTLGFKYWFMNKLYRNSFSPFVGLNYLGVKVPSDYLGYYYYDKRTIAVPVGISYTAKSGLHVTLQHMIEPEDFMNVELAVGWRFNLDKRKR
jgi:hypothetical protein